MEGTDVLVIDDEREARTLARRVFERAGLVVTEAADGDEGLRELYRARPGVVLLDIGLAGADGWRVLAEVRELSDVLVVMISVRSSESEKVRALHAGADGYVTKPFGNDDVVARVQALLRRKGRDGEESTKYVDGLVEIDVERHVARAGGADLLLTALQYRLLTAFVEHPHEVLSTDRLLSLAWPGSAHGRPRVQVGVGSLRAKFRDVGAEAPIETVRGLGYRYRPPRPGKPGVPGGHG